MTPLVCELCLIVYCILIIVDSIMCKKKVKKKKLHLCIIFISLPIGHVYGCDTIFH